MTAAFDYWGSFPTAAARDVAGLVLGDRLGSGTTRVIYEHATDPDLIIKIEDGARSFCNVAEWSVWQSVKETKFARWFAPAVAISAAGIVIVMKRCKELRPEELPERVPAFFTDLKAENWGLYEGRPVCLDYGYHLLLERGMTKAMRKAQSGLAYMTLPHQLPITDPAAWCFICGEPYKDCPTPVDCRLVPSPAPADTED